MISKTINYLNLQNTILVLFERILLKNLLLNLFIIFSLILSIADAAMKVSPIKEAAFISADYIEYDEVEDFIYAKGNVRIGADNYLINTENVIYDISKDLLWAKGEIKITEGSDKIILGNAIIFRNKLKEGIISDFVMKFKKDNSIIAARLAKRVSKDQVYLHKTTFTPCTVTCNSKPIWQLSSKETYMDLEEEKLIYRNLFFEVYGIPVFFTPYFSHPTPGAKAQSGILIPSIKKSNLSIPLYLRAKPNADLTLTPRLANKYTIFELEGRHKLINGYYEINSSYGEVPYKNKRIHSAHLSSFGNFHSDSYNYGFNINRTTDKAYLKNYHERHDSYLTSNIYFNNVKDYNYLLLEGMHFQGLRNEDLNSTDPLILPKLRTKNIIDVTEDGTTYALIQSDTLAYREPKGTQIERGSLNLALINNVRTSEGHLLNFTGRIRDDLYFIQDKHEVNSQKKIRSRTIPEIQAGWRYPLINRINTTNIIIEPITSMTLGKKFKSNYNEYGFIDPSRYEISEENMFEANRYSGIDYHEFGSRFNYGVNTAILHGPNYYDVFLGQFLHKNNTYTNDSVGNIGKISANLFDVTELFYKFRRDKHYKSIREEVGGDFWWQNLQLNTTFIKLENIRKYYASEDFVSKSNHARQFYYNIQYQLNSNWALGHDMRFDLASKKIQPLNKSIRVTYFKDCVSIGLKLYDDYTFDVMRGVRKTRSKSVTLGLKVLNM